MRRLAPACGGFAGLLIVLLTALPVSAATVTREAAPLPPLIEDDSCGYLIDVTFPVNDEYVTTFYDNNGSMTKQIVTGSLFVTFTNPDNHASVTANISGPGVFNAIKGTFEQLGRGGGPLPGFDFLVLFAGQVGSNGTHGHLFLDVCAALA